jgi:hypothetical protein
MHYFLISSKVYVPSSLSDFLVPCMFEIYFGEHLVCRRLQTLSRCMYFESHYHEGAQLLARVPKAAGQFTRVFVSDASSALHASAVTCKEIL